MEFVRKDFVMISKIGRVLLDVKRPLKERFRALFTLRNIGGEHAIREIEAGFADSSVLLKHECAYCLGQMQDPLAIPKLESILEDSKEDAIVRHEAAEALAAIGDKKALPLLKQYAKDSCIEVAETCQLAVQKIEEVENPESHQSASIYSSVDPTSPLTDCKSVKELQTVLLDDSESLYRRYQAMFSLRNINTKESALALSKGLNCGSALFRHEVAFVLGQMQNPVTVEALSYALMNDSEHEMVRHECAEALGSIATEDCTKILNKFLADEKRIVRESCEVALDMCDYENSTEFQYADALMKEGAETSVLAN